MNGLRIHRNFPGEPMSLCLTLMFQPEILAADLDLKVFLFMV